MLRIFAAKSGDEAQVRRLLAPAVVLESHSRTEAAELSGMDRQTLRDWIHRYNDEGLDGLKSRSAPGRAAALNEQQMAELKALVIQGPDPSDGQSRALAVRRSTRRGGALLLCGSP